MVLSLVFPLSAKKQENKKLLLAFCHRSNYPIPNKNPTFFFKKRGFVINHSAAASFNNSW